MQLELDLTGGRMPLPEVVEHFGFDPDALIRKLCADGCEAGSTVQPGREASPVADGWAVPCSIFDMFPAGVVLVSSVAAEDDLPPDVRLCVTGGSLGFLPGFSESMGALDAPDWSPDGGCWCSDRFGASVGLVSRPGWVLQ